MSVKIMRVYTIFYSGSRTDLDDKVIASSPMEAAKKFVIENKGRYLVHLVIG